MDRVCAEHRKWFLWCLYASACCKPCSHGMYKICKSAACKLVIIVWLTRVPYKPCWTTALLGLQTLSVKRPETLVKPAHMAITRTGQKCWQTLFWQPDWRRCSIYFIFFLNKHVHSISDLDKPPQFSCSFTLCQNFGVLFSSYLSFHEFFKFSWCRLYIILHWCLTGIQSVLNI